MVADQLDDFISENAVLEHFQSHFRGCCSTETVLLKVVCVLLAADTGHPSILVLLDLSTVFNTVDHSILLGLEEVSVAPTSKIGLFMSVVASTGPLVQSCIVGFLRVRYSANSLFSLYATSWTTFKSTHQFPPLC